MINNEKLNLHFSSSISGSIYEITKDLVEPLSKHFNLSKEWEGQFLEKKDRDILLLHFLDPQIIDHPLFDDFFFKVLIQPIDGTVIREDVVAKLNKFDLIICPAEASKNIMIENGVYTNIIVIPNYYKSNIFEKQIYTPILKSIPSDKIVFYHESTFHPRKGIELLYEGFVKAFSNTPYADSVILIVKDMPYNKLNIFKIEELKRETMKLQKTFKKPTSIYKFSCFLDEEELKQLWNRADIYVSLAKIEGFGIPMLRMFLMNKPIICLENEYSGYSDYLNKNNSYQIPTIQHKAKDEFMWLYTKESSWAIPNISDVVDTFRKCLDDFLKGSCKTIQRSLVDTPMGLNFQNTVTKYLDKYSFSKVSNEYVDSIIKFYNLKKSKN